MPLVFYEIFLPLNCQPKTFKHILNQDETKYTQPVLTPNVQIQHPGLWPSASTI